MSKFLTLGMPLPEVIERSTVVPAKALQRPELGTFGKGNVGDASILSLEDGAFPMEDVRGLVETSPQRLKAEGVVLAGRWWHGD